MTKLNINLLQIFQFNRVDSLRSEDKQAKNSHHGSAAIFPLRSNNSSSVSEHAEVLMAGKA